MKYTPKQAENAARAKARNDWRDCAEYCNSYEIGSLERVAYDSEFGKVSNMFNENGAMYG